MYAAPQTNEESLEQVYFEAQQRIPEGTEHPLLSDLYDLIQEERAIGNTKLVEALSEKYMQLKNWE